MSIEENQLKSNQVKQKDDEMTNIKNRVLVDKQEIIYAFKIFFQAIFLDTQHGFNIVYFCLSVLGIFYHTVFSFLLLDIVIKIPLLQSVV
jgi:hypothetical protein